MRDGYAKIAKQGSSCHTAKSCCGNTNLARTISKGIGYSEEEMNNVPESANLGLGCGNPVVLASLKEGDVVLDLGSGAGFDAFLVARKVGKTGRVIGVDMTPEMIEKAKANARKTKCANIEFRLSEIEKLPVESNSIDVIISNCVINLSPDKESVFKEVFRVLKLGGRLMVSDMVLVKELPVSIRESVEVYVGCLAGAARKEDYLKFIEDAGFKDIEVSGQTNYPIKAMANDAITRAIMKNLSTKETDLSAIENSVVSIKIHAVKPVS